MDQHLSLLQKAMKLARSRAQGLWTRNSAVLAGQQSTAERPYPAFFQLPLVEDIHTRGPTKAHRRKGSNGGPITPSSPASTSPNLRPGKRPHSSSCIQRPIRRHEARDEGRHRLRRLPVHPHRGTAHYAEADDARPASVSRSKTPFEDLLSDQRLRKSPEMTRSYNGPVLRPPPGLDWPLGEASLSRSCAYTGTALAKRRGPSSCHRSLSPS